jgi:hypothetical protein
MNRAVFDALKSKPGIVENTRRNFEGQLKALNEALELRVKMAAQIADDPKSTAAEATAVARAEIETAEVITRKTETQLFDLVPLGSESKVSNSMGFWETTLRLRGRTAAASDLRLTDSGGADDLIKFFGKLNKKNEFVPGVLRANATIEEMQTLRSRILTEIRKLKASNGSRNKIRIMGELQERILADMGESAGGPELELALAFSRSANEKFKQGIVGKLLGFDKSGAVAVPEALTLETALGGNSPKAAQNVRDIIKAVKGNQGNFEADMGAFMKREAGKQGLRIDELTAPEFQGLTAQFKSQFGGDDVSEVTGAMENFIKVKFQKAAIKSNTIDSHAAESFMKSNEELLNEFPKLRDEISSAIQSNNVKLIRQRRLETTGSKMNDTRVSKAALYIEKGPSKAFTQISGLRPQDIKREMAGLISKAARDPSGKATEGLQGSFFDWLLERATLAPGGTRVSASGDSFISGLKLTRMMEDKSIRSMAKQLLTKDQLTRLDKIIRTAKRVDQSLRTTGSKEGVIGDPVGATLSFVARLFGAAQGERVSKIFGTGALQMQSVLSNRAVDIVRRKLKDPAAKILHDAFIPENPGDTKLLEALLTDIVDEKTQKKVAVQVQAWLAVTLYELGEKTVPELIEEEDNE